MMGKIALSFFAASFAFLAISIAMFLQKDVSLATFLLFYLFGFGSGCFLVGGVLLTVLPKKIQKDS